MAGSPFRIVEAIYPGMTQLDFTAPHTVFSRIPNTETIVASEAGGPVNWRAALFSPARAGWLRSIAAI